MPGLGAEPCCIFMPFRVHAHWALLAFDVGPPDLCRITLLDCPIGTCTERARSLAAAFCQSVSLRTTCFEEVCGLSPNAQTSSGAGVLAHAALLLTAPPAQTCLLVATDFLQRFHRASACLLQLSPETWDEANLLPACVPNSFASLSQSWSPGLSRSIPALPGRASMCTDTQLDDEDDGTSPSCQLCHDWYMGVRVGEASHPEEP